jgi:hypothetical protein
MSVFPLIPAPLETYAAQFDDLFSRGGLRQAFRQYLSGLLLPAELNKTLTALAHAEPIVGAQHPAVQWLPWFLSESTWDVATITRRLQLLREDPSIGASCAGCAHRR